MNRPKLLIFSDKMELKNSIARYVKYACEGLKHDFNPERHAITYSLIDEITDVLGKEPPAALLNTSVILDLTSTKHDATWNPLRKGLFKTDAAATLTLMYPEVYWIFLGLSVNLPLLYAQDNERPYWPKEHFVDPLDSSEGEMAKILKLLKRHEDGYNPLFDPSGLRAWLKLNTFIKLKSDKDLSTTFYSSRQKIAAAIDEEDDYTFLHGYLAYKMGYRSYAIDSASMMGRLFKSSSPPDLIVDELFDGKIDLTFEDVFLGFPDKSGKDNLSNLHDRDEKFDKLRSVSHRIFVTVGHKHINWHKQNDEHLRNLKDEGKTIRTVFKPSGGIYNFLEKSGLFKQYWNTQIEKWRHVSPSNENDDGHSAPGKLLLIADSLIKRARKIYGEAQTVQECIHGAVLAAEASEILNYKTPTTCFEAISLRHKCEVKAECMFYGVEYNIDVKSRFRDLEGEINIVSKWFNPRNRQSSSLNARMSIVTEIMRVFEEYGQFDEQQDCLVYLRNLTRKWYFTKHRQLIFFLPFRFYFETLISSLGCFFIAILLWPLLGGLISYSLGAEFDGTSITNKGIFAHIVNAISTFFGIQPAQFPTNPAAMFITVALIFGGFLHLGVFISHLYTLITRGK